MIANDSLVNASVKLLNSLQKDLKQGLAKKSGIDLDNNYAYGRLSAMSECLSKINSDNSQEAKLAAVTAFENSSKKSTSGWGKFKKVLSGFIVAAACAVLGFVVGAAVGAAATSWTGPGAIVGAIAGGFTGAKAAVATAAAGTASAAAATGTAATFKFFKSNMQKKTNKEFIDAANEKISPTAKKQP